MIARELGTAGEQALERVLGYLNFSSGNPDAKATAALNSVFESLLAAPVATPPWKLAGLLLNERLTVLRATSPAFADAVQAENVLRITFDELIPAYLEFHRDLLFHQKPAELLNSFLVARMLEAVLRAGSPWDEESRVVSSAIKRLNDYIGHRPVAALESQRIEPYAHEWVRPVPLYIEGVGAAAGPYREVVERALELLNQTESEILQAAFFHPQNLAELSYDPRAYDFDHPANKRPNYHFGQWDPNLIDNRGVYRRYVVQQVTLEALTSRIYSEPTIPREQLLFEAAAVLAGTILMGGGISGDRPESHDSTVTLSNLLPRIARYRDAFYERLLAKVKGAHEARLLVEASERRQPFGGARQHLNAQLARRRASQLEHVHIAQIYARMGFSDSAKREADVVPCASARMLCHIDCLLSATDLALERQELAVAAEKLPETVAWLKRAIECGAIIDPWNILGFDAQYSLFPAAENSVRDHRADELAALMEQIFGAHSRVWGEAAARDDKNISIAVARQFKDLTHWWHRFAAHEVSNVDAVNGIDAYRAAEHVAQALNLWHKDNPAAGDVKFWASHAAMFDTPKAYGLVIDALLDRGDLVAAQALLIHWLTGVEQIGLEKGEVSFHDLAERWFGEATTRDDAWRHVSRFLDYLEANAETYWQVPAFQIESKAKRNDDAGEPVGVDIDDEDQETYDAAYDDMVYNDSTDDGIDGQVFDPGMPSHDEFMLESRRLDDRLQFLSTIATLWRRAALRAPIHGEYSSPVSETLLRWTAQAQDNFVRLLSLLDAVKAFRLPPTSGDHDSMVEYDRVRLAKETLLDRVMTTVIETADAHRLLRASARASGAADYRSSTDGEDEAFRDLFAHLMHGDIVAVQRRMPEVLELLATKPLLYVPLAKGGDPREIVKTKLRQHAIEDLLAWLPRCGLLIETCRLIEAAREMERLHAVGSGAVTEFDEMFKIGYRSLVEALVVSSEAWGPPEPDAADERDGPQSALVDCLEQLTESILVSWLSHSRTLRLSVLERVHEKKAWKKLVDFIEKFGEDLFTQRFLNLGNARAILHQGVANWLKRLLDDHQPESSCKLIDALQAGEPLPEAAEQLSLVLESIVENYGEYRDYNSTTTQSDRGELLYMLLDFLRLRTKYDRVCWNLKPVVVAHEILVRSGQDDAARLWRRALAERISAEADQYLAQLAKLQKQYAMRMPTVADRLNERFIRPMSIDRIRALVTPAIQEARSGGKRPVFELLEEEVELLAREPTGVGLDVPAWVVALEEEVDRARRPRHRRTWEEELKAAVKPTMMTLEETQEQIDAWTSR